MTRILRDDNWRSIGLLGGVGPAAAAHMHALLISEAQRRGARADQTFPPVLVFNVPLPGTSPTGYEPSLSPQITAAIRSTVAQMIDAGAEVILPACNSLAFCASEAATSLALDLIDLPLLAAREAAAQGLQRVGVICSRTARDLGVHYQALQAHGIDVCELAEDEQQRVDRLIEALMGDRPDSRHTEELFELAGRLSERGAERVIVGCTELSLCNQAASELIDTALLGVRCALDLAWEGVTDARQ